MSGQGEPDLGGPDAAVRLIFTYEGDEVRLLSRQRVRMTLPPGDPAAAEAAAAAPGVWAEVRAADEGVLHRQRMVDPLPSDVEVFSDDPDGSVRRAPLAWERGAFTVVVPEYAEADHLALVAQRTGAEPEAGTAEAGDRAAPAREIVRVSLRPPADEPGAGRGAGAGA